MPKKNHRKQRRHVPAKKRKCHVNNHILSSVMIKKRLFSTTILCGNLRMRRTMMVFSCFTVADLKLRTGVFMNCMLSPASVRLLCPSGVVQAKCTCELTKASVPSMMSPCGSFPAQSKSHQTQSRQCQNHGFVTLSCTEQKCSTLEKQSSG